MAGAPVEVGSLGLLLPELFDQRLADLDQLDGDDVGENTVVDHNPDKLTQVGFQADQSDQLVESDRVKVQINTQHVQLQRLIVDDGGAGIELHGFFARRLRIHGDQEVDFL